MTLLVAALTGQRCLTCWHGLTPDSRHGAGLRHPAVPAFTCRKQSRWYSCSCHTTSAGLQAAWTALHACSVCWQMHTEMLGLKTQAA